MSSLVRLAMADPFRGRMLSITCSEEQIQECSEFLRNCILVNNKEFDVVPISGQDSYKIARTALKYLSHAELKEDFQGCLEQYYAGHFYIPELKTRAVKQLLKIMDDQDVVSKRQLLQAAAVTRDTLLLFYSFGALTES